MVAPAILLANAGAAFAQEPDGKAGPAGATLDTSLDRHGRPTAAVMINGRGPYQFLVDTGSNATVIAMRHVAALATPLLQAVTIYGTTGSMESQLVRLDVLSTGAARLEDFEVAVLDDEALGTLDGILGANAFVGHRLLFDIGAATVTVEDTARTRGYRREQNMRVRDGHIAEVQGRIGRVDARMMLDTGADMCIVNDVLMQRIRRSFPALNLREGVGVRGVTGRVVVGDYFQIPNIELGNVRLRNVGGVAVNAAIFDYWNLQDEPAMIVGVNLLSLLDGFSIDYGAGKFEALQLALLAENAASPRG